MKLPEKTIMVEHSREYEFDNENIRDIPIDLLKKWIKKVPRNAVNIRIRTDAEYFDYEGYDEPKLYLVWDVEEENEDYDRLMIKYNKWLAKREK
jgi:hypothetical protein